MAVHAALLFIDTMTYVDMVFQAAQGYMLMHEINQTKTRHSGEFDFPVVGESRGHHPHLTSVHHFARHGLCSNFKGKKRLYNAMKTKICGVQPNFIANLVLTLCKERGKTLDVWVSELFDLDGDQLLDHFEKTRFR